MAETQRQRIDKWLWFARMVKSRTLAAKLVTGGHVRINALRQETAAKLVSAGDVLTISLEQGVHVLKVLGPGVRRGPNEEARLLYEDLTPPDVASGPQDTGPGAADPGSGRSTKKDRRDMEKWRGEA